MNKTGNGAPSEDAAEELGEFSRISAEEQKSKVEFRVINGNGVNKEIKYPNFGDRIRAITGIDVKIVNEPQMVDEQAIIKALTDDEPEQDPDEIRYQKTRERLVKILLDES